MKNVKLLFIFFLLLSCEKNDKIKDCGCDSITLKTIHESQELTGIITFKAQNKSNNYYTNSYWITYVEPNCSICVHHMIVCNEYILNDFADLKSPPYNSTSVKFAGHLKEVCEKRFDTGNITYQQITITKIEKQ
ncbi:MAG: hypothetical protein ACK57K_05285 [Chryseotalea sp.]|jgi:hypothetical protein|nr:hypothetical protein [Flammeovirgaceae bacterium]